jgi:hypothetical protein
MRLDLGTSDRSYLGSVVHAALWSLTIVYTLLHLGLHLHLLLLLLLLLLPEEGQLLGIGLRHRCTGQLTYRLTLIGHRALLMLLLRC